MTDEEIADALRPFARADRAIGSEPGPFRFETGRGFVEITRESLRNAATALTAIEAMKGNLEGHGEPCYYCGKPCSSLDGSPGEWPIMLCHQDEPGVGKWHHEKCISERLSALEARKGKPEQHDYASDANEMTRTWPQRHASVLKALREADDRGFERARGIIVEFLRKPLA